ncbi:MAG: DUF2281 domain-containing protein [Armatimonadetes bacterium]|nr:DUF2281 domain-containing protein [Armatimonadota bacterium]
MQTVNLQEAQSHLDELIEAAVNGETIFIAQEDRPLVQLVPVVADRRRPQFGSAKGLITMSEDFDKPLADFKEYEK